MLNIGFVFNILIACLTAGCLVIAGIAMGIWHYYVIAGMLFIGIIASGIERYWTGWQGYYKLLKDIGILK